jgi:hypothetical protein
MNLIHIQCQYKDFYTVNQLYDSAMNIRSTPEAYDFSVCYS